MHRRHLAMLGLAWLSGARPALGANDATAKAAASSGTPGADAGLSSIASLTPSSPLSLGPAVGGPSSPLPASGSLRLLSEEFPPVNFSESGQARGLTVDIVNAIQQRLGQSLPIQILPWARAFREASEGKTPTALFATARIPEREHLFHWVGPIVQLQSSFYARAGSGLQLKDLDEARRAGQVLVVRDWYTHQLLTKAGFRNLNPINDPTQGVRMLVAGRATLFAVERAVLPRTLAQEGMKASSLEEVFTFASSEGYIAFSKSTPPGTVAAWQSQLNELKRDGSFLALYKRWLPNDKPPG